MIINKSNNEIEICVPLKRYWSLILYSGAIAIIFLLKILKLISIGSKIYWSEHFGLLFFCPIFLFYFIWLTFGYERVIITSNKLIYFKSVWLFRLEKIIFIEDILNIKLVNQNYLNNSLVDELKQSLVEFGRAFPFWKKMGRIEIDYKYGNFTLLNGLKAKDFKVVIELMSTGPPSCS